MRVIPTLLVLRCVFQKSLEFKKKNISPSDLEIATFTNENKENVCFCDTKIVHVCLCLLMCYPLESLWQPT